MSGVRLMMVMFGCLASLAQAQLNIDLSKASLDTETGNYCVVQKIIPTNPPSDSYFACNTPAESDIKVCITNPPEALTSAGCAAAIPEGCECSVETGEGCDPGYSCSDRNCKCLLDGCECDPAANDADTFCDIDEVCKDDCSCGRALPRGCECDPYAQDPDSFCQAGMVCENCQCVRPLPPGCQCDPYAEDPDSFCNQGEMCKDCKCKKPLPPGCDCDPYDPNPDSFCQGGQVCQDCKCSTPLPPGCDCDPYAPNPDSFCPRGLMCKNCMCQTPLPAGCDCDPRDPNPDSSCSSGQVCQDCMCTYPLHPGCSCNPNAPDADSFCPAGQFCKDDCSCGSPLGVGCDCNESLGYGCPGELLCVGGCTCQACEQSMTRGGEVLNPPLVFVIDTTKSVKPDKDSIFNLTMKVVSNIMKDEINIPRYQLVTFNDYGPDIQKNVNIELDTADVREFGRAAASIKFESFNGGRDSKERLTQGLLIALQNADPKSLVVVFTDNGTKNLNLEKPIIKLRDEKECEVYIVLTPVYEGKPNGKSLPVYNRLGTVFEIEKVNSETFLKQVEAYEENNCV